MAKMQNGAVVVTFLSALLGLLTVLYPHFKGESVSVTPAVDVHGDLVLGDKYGGYPAEALEIPVLALERGADWRQQAQACQTCIRALRENPRMQHLLDLRKECRCGVPSH